MLVDSSPVNVETDPFSDQILNTDLPSRPQESHDPSNQISPVIPPKPEQPPGADCERDKLQRTIGRCHMTLATGLGSSLAYAGLAMELGEIPSAIVGVVGLSAVVDRLAKRSFDASELGANAETYPLEYGKGLYSVAPFLLTAGGLGFKAFSTAGEPILGAFALAGGVSLLRLGWAERRYDQLKRDGSK